MDDTKKAGMYDKYSIKVHDVYELEYWAKKFGISPDELLDIIKEIGNSSIDVKQHIKSKL